MAEYPELEAVQAAARADDVGEAAAVVVQLWEGDGAAAAAGGVGAFAAVGVISCRRFESGENGCEERRGWCGFVGAAAAVALLDDDVASGAAGDVAVAAAGGDGHGEGQ